MLKYLKAAFLLRPPVPGVGALPLNLLALASFGILGVAEPALWLLGVGLETAYLAALASSPRFQRVVDGRELLSLEGEDESKRRGLVAQLGPGARQRLAALEAKCERAVEVYRQGQPEEVLVEHNHEALRKLSWIFLKLLIAQRTLQAMNEPGAEADLRSRIANLQREARSDELSPTARESKAATLQILEKRLAHLEHRERSMAEIESDLVRIEAQVDLALDNAALQEQPRRITADLGLVSQLLDSGLFGESEGVVSDLDRAFARTGEEPVTQ